MGDYLTDYFEFAFKDCVNQHTGSYVWLSTDESISHSHCLVAYDPDHDRYEDVDDWDILKMVQDARNRGDSSQPSLPFS